MIYNKAPEETKILSDISSNVIAHFTEEETKLFCVKRALEAKRLLEREQLLDYAFMEVSDALDIELLRRARNTFAQSELLLVADMEVSPMKYLTPDIRAASLLLRPFNKEQCERTVREFFRNPGQCKRVAYEIGQILDFPLLVIVGENHGILFLLEFFYLPGKVGSGRNRFVDEPFFNIHYLIV